MLLEGQGRDQLEAFLVALLSVLDPVRKKNVTNAIIACNTRTFRFDFAQIVYANVCLQATLEHHGVQMLNCVTGTAPREVVLLAGAFPTCELLLHLLLLQ